MSTGTPHVVGRVLVADDDASVRFVLSRAMQQAGHEVVEAADGDAAVRALDESAFDVALVDVRMPGRDGFAVLDHARTKGDAAPAVLLLTALDEGKHAIEAMKRGAWDYLAKPFDVDEVEILVARAIASRRLAEEVKRLRGGDPAAEPGTPDSGIVGKSRAMREVFKAIGRVAPTLETVLLLGPSGSGKELVARAIHAHSPRAGAPFLAVNCAAIPAELLESELFGATRGAFTGAVADRPGRFQAARGGTLFLDEIGELPRPLQAKLLRAVQSREVTPLGATAPVKTDVRLIAATNADLPALVEQGAFRDDLYYRLRVVEISLPPLEERREDIPLLAAHFAARAAREAGVPAKSIAPKALEMLAARRWPGNVRELENAVRRAVVQARGETLGPTDFEAPPAPVTAEEEGSFEEIVRRKLKPFVEGMASAAGEHGTGDLFHTVLALVERPLIELALEKTGGNRVRAARLLGLNRNTL
ncbi:MAG TPA: sigma-54 dependent transcriptional regulator, partial [Gemmatimonadaceae bacterium]|nr:sigma-54 dependent transcriptional regulator [Gemmatimonadaceae bacterium]